MGKLDAVKVAVLMVGTVSPNTVPGWAFSDGKRKAVPTRKGGKKRGKGRQR